MKKDLQVISFSLFLLCFCSCVSKKQYNSLAGQHKLDTQALQNKLDTEKRISDSLRIVVAQRDSIIDSLSYRIADVQKKDKSKPIVSSAKRSSLSAEQACEKKAIFIYNFTKFIEWPLEYNGTEFVIGVVGEESIVKQVQGFMADKKTFGKKIVVKKYVKGAKYNIVFLSSLKAGNIYTIKNEVKRNKTVLISDDDGNGTAHISFTVDDDKIRYSVNKNAIEKMGLKVAQELMRYSG
jgi:hypothetical protein